FTIEPMINLGGRAIRTLADGWTIVTADGSLSAQFEHTVLVTESGCEVLTRGAASEGGQPRHATSAITSRRTMGGGPLLPLPPGQHGSL
ncbi:MAG: hypothetical protein R3B70_47215, partial [Polyangiaceae bacterium]